MSCARVGRPPDPCSRGPVVPWFLNNVACNSLATISNIEITSLEFCGFLDTYEKLGYPNYVRVLVDEAPPEGRWKSLWPATWERATPKPP